MEKEENHVLAGKHISRQVIESILDQKESLGINNFESIKITYSTGMDLLVQSMANFTRNFPDEFPAQMVIDRTVEDLKDSFQASMMTTDVEVLDEDG